MEQREPSGIWKRAVSMVRTTRSERSVSVYERGRTMTDVPLPLRHRLTEYELYGSGNMPDLGLLKHHLSGEGRLELSCIERLITQVMEVLIKDPNIVCVDGTVKVIGAVCGQYFDLIEIMKKVNLKKEKCVFMGKYAWDGGFNTETMIYIYALKILHPENVVLLRSQRESRLCAKTNFKTECLVKYNAAIYNCFCNSFDHLPLVALVNKETICIHGGISPRALTLREINKIDRFMEPPPRGALTDMLWADPDPNFGEEAPGSPFFTFNVERFISVYFTYVAFKTFMDHNELSCLIRGNQPLFSGFFEYPMPPQPWTARQLSMKSVFSTPNFKGKRNSGAMLTLTPNKTEISRFLWVESPYWLPNFIDVFTWSLPFLARKSTMFVEDLLELMDRDTAADDVKAALGKKQERSNVLNLMKKEQKDSLTVLDFTKSQQRQVKVIFSPATQQAIQPEMSRKSVFEYEYADSDEVAEESEVDEAVFDLVVPVEAVDAEEGDHIQPSKKKFLKILCGCGSNEIEDEEEDNRRGSVRKG